MISDLPIRDLHTGLDIPGGRCITLTGEQALALVRSRHAEYFDGTAWSKDPRGDFSRIEHQHIFLRALIGGLLDELDDPSSIDDFITVATESLVVDEGLDPREMLSTAWTIRGIGLRGLDTATVQSSGTVVDGMAVLVPTEEQIAEAAEFLRSGTPEPEISRNTEGGSGASSTTGVPTVGSPAVDPALRPCDS
jgi:anionic cell wall polymer biosynthesis LytR-Cps2A-Psr (LCP) family protein